MNEYAGVPLPNRTAFTIASRSIAYEMARRTCTSWNGFLRSLNSM